MASTSGGSEKEYTAKRPLRHHSIGSMQYSTEEINNIIGSSMVNKKEEIRKHLDKDKLAKTIVNKSDQAAAANNNSKAKDMEENDIHCPTQFNFLNFETNTDNVFKPRGVLTRTPPPTVQQTEDEVEKNPSKRQRSETSPELPVNKKRQYYENNTQQEDQTETCLSGKLILDIFSNLDKFNEIASRNTTEISSNEQISLREAHNNLHKLITLMVLNTSTLEKENIKIKNALYLNMSKSDQTNTNRIIGSTTNRTYAQIANNQPSTIEKTNITEPEKWTTPKTTMKHETIIRIENISDPKQAMKTFKQQIDIKDMGSGFKSIRPTKDGAIIVESHDKNQQNKLQSVIKDKDQIAFKESECSDPTFIITGIEKGFSDEEFLEELERLNTEIVEDLQTTIRDKIRVVTKRQCRNPFKENWILQAPANIAKWFLKKRTVYFDLVTVYVQEHINLAMCFKCNGFEHVAKYCKEKDCCHKCGGEHSASNCSSEALQCPNCHKMKLQDLNHSARNIDCPVYKKRLERYRNKINYNGDFLR